MSPFGVIAERLAEISKRPMKAGGHSSLDEGFCMMEAVAYVAGEPFSATPDCACPVLGSFMRAWNDDLATDADRDRLLKPLIPRLIGTRSTPEVELRRSQLALDWFVRTSMPTVLDLVDNLKPIAAKLRALAPMLSREAIHASDDLIAEAAREAAASWDASWAASWAASWDASRDASWDASWDASRDASRAASRDASWAASRAASWDVVEQLAATKNVGVSDLSYQEVYDAVYQACVALFAPTRNTLERSALQLIEAMLAVTPEALAEETGPAAS